MGRRPPKYHGARGREKLKMDVEAGLVDWDGNPIEIKKSETEFVIVSVPKSRVLEVYEFLSKK